MRDRADNFVVICSIENIDPMGVHTGDCITVAPALTLTDKEYQRMRDAARRIIREIGVETGGSNIQFAVNPDDGRMVVIEMNPRVSRSSALASKATGFPIAKIAAKLALGYTLDEIPNDITRVTPASFEPTIDYVVVKIPRWTFEKFPRRRRDADDADEVGRRGDGHRPHLQGSVHEGVRSLELGRSRRSTLDRLARATPTSSMRAHAQADAPIGSSQVARRSRLGARPSTRASRAHEDRSVVPTHSSIEIVAREESAARPALDALDADALRELKRAGLRDRRARARCRCTTEDDVRAQPRGARGRAGLQARRHLRAPSSSRTRRISTRRTSRVRSASPTDRKKVVILGSGPNRIGQGIEFDYCCCHAAFALREEGSRR